MSHSWKQYQEMVDKLTEEKIAEAIGPIDKWAHNCHAASLALVKSGLLGQGGIDCRVARGSCRGVGGQHSWAVLGMDCYDTEAWIVDITAWSYTDNAPRIWITDMTRGPHRPHGMGPRMIEWGCPENGDGEHIELTPSEPFGAEARMWLSMFKGAVGNLDRRFWSNLANHAPVNGWTAGEVYKAMSETEEVRALLPIDRLGMLTDLNPEELYW